MLLWFTHEREHRKTHGQGQDDTHQAHRRGSKAAEKSWIAWDEKLTGFGVRVQPSGMKSFIVNYRGGSGGRKAPNKRVVIGRYGRIAPDQARRMAQDLLGRVARGEDPAGERSDARGVPTLARAFEIYMAANPDRAVNTVRLYKQNLRVNLSDWLKRPLDAITRQDVETASISSRANTAGRRPTRRSRCCARSTAGPASISRVCAIRLICGWRPGGASTASGGGGYRARPRCCPAGAQG